MAFFTVNIGGILYIIEFFAFTYSITIRFLILVDASQTTCTSITLRTSRETFFTNLLAAIYKIEFINTLAHIILLANFCCFNLHKYCMSMTCGSLNVCPLNK